MFQQVPMVEIDGMKLVQTRAILNYIATKYDLYGKDMKERALYGTFSVLSWVISRNNPRCFLEWLGYVHGDHDQQQLQTLVV